MAEMVEEVTLKLDMEVALEVETEEDVEEMEVANFHSQYWPPRIHSAVEYSLSYNVML